MGSLIENKNHTLKEMKLISAIVATATAAVIQTGQWNGVDNDNTCGSTWEWQDENGDALSIVNATCDNSTCWDVVPDCQANPNNEGLPGLYIQENINDHRGSQDSWNLQVHGVSQGDVLTFDFQGNNDVTNLTTAFGTVSGSGNSWAVSVQEAPFGDLFQLEVSANSVPDLFSTTVA